MQGHGVPCFDSEYLIANKHGTPHAHVFQNGILIMKESARSVVRTEIYPVTAP